ncbi:hypothetical protein [Streptacidiphilus jiangxiensis]|uniref:hypothetical protein n=1 Tax=Streptacidiphilus jiangxiensis TaxID=235985 RepID=UPI0005A737FA|nr:hypothetical protein [Streptacidiphilus jiangxiensis]
MLTNVDHGITALIPVVAGYAMYVNFGGQFGRTPRARRRYRRGGIALMAFGLLLVALTLWVAVRH